MRKSFSTTTRLSIGLASITMTILFLAQLIGLVPDLIRPQLESRAKLCESLAIQFSLAAQNDQLKIIQAAAPLIVQRNPELLSIAVSDSEGKYLIETEGHKSFWETMPDEQSATSHVEIPIKPSVKYITL